MQPHLTDVLSSSVAYMDALWDQDTGLVWAPDGRSHGVRQSAWYALGLVLGGGPHDPAERAVRIRAAVAAVLDNQWDRPGAIHHGTFRRTPDEPDPPESSVIWQHYDPNWRQFIGTVLALCVWRLEADLPPALHGRVERAVAMAVEGEPEDRVPASYANIALMKAWLQAEFGRAMGRPELVAAGEAFARAVTERFEESGAFDEYNSPTYYGVDLYALGLWRGFPPSPMFGPAGSRIEAALWRDIARFYHAGLANLCGPFDRAYGMDMTRYASLLGLSIWAARGRDGAPFPAVSMPRPGAPPPFGHSHDFCFGPCLAAVGVAVPDDAAVHLQEFAGERTVRQELRGRTMTAWLSRDVMIGAQDGGTRPAAGQFHPATVHFAAPGGGVAWIRAWSPGYVDAVAAPGELRLRARPRDGVPHSQVVLRASVPWTGVGEVPGLTMAIEGAGAGQATVDADDPHKLLLPGDGTYTIRPRPAS